MVFTKKTLFFYVIFQLDKEIGLEIMDLFDNPVGCLTSLAFFRAKALQKCDF
jgi:hypothetical protein